MEVFVWFRWIGPLRTCTSTHTHIHWETRKMKSPVHCDVMQYSSSVINNTSVRHCRSRFCFSECLRDFLVSFLHFKGALRSFPLNKSLFTSSVTHQSALSVSLRPDKHVECIYFLIQRFHSILLFPRLCWCITAFLGTLLPPVDQNRKPLIKRLLHGVYYWWNNSTFVGAFNTGDVYTYLCF